MTTEPVVHTEGVFSDGRSDRPYIARCTCGWKGSKFFVEPGPARAEADEHAAQVAS